VSIGGIPRRSGRGRRDNGLVAAEYAVAGDVDPRVGEHLLDVLGAGGIAAYLQPAVDLHPVTRTTTMPARPTDRLFVDREHLDTARDYISQLTSGAAAQPGELGAAEVEAEWAQIIADFDADVAPETAPWPDSENVAGVETGAPPAEPEASEPPPARPALRRMEQASLLDALDTFGADLADDDEGSYTPPPAPPLPRPSVVAVLSVLAIAGGFVLFIRPELAPIDQNLAQMAGFAAVLAGVVALIWRLRPGDDEDAERDPDDGAVV
jgi:hypothetical protein